MYFLSTITSQNFEEPIRLRNETMRNVIPSHTHTHTTHTHTHTHTCTHTHTHTLTHTHTVTHYTHTYHTHTHTPHTTYTLHTHHTPHTHTHTHTHHTHTRMYTLLVDSCLLPHQTRRIILLLFVTWGRHKLVDGVGAPGVQLLHRTRGEPAVAGEEAC